MEPAPGFPAPRVRTGPALRTTGTAGRTRGRTPPARRAEASRRPHPDTRGSAPRTGSGCRAPRTPVPGGAWPATARPRSNLPAPTADPARKPTPADPRTPGRPAARPRPLPPRLWRVRAPAAPTPRPASRHREGAAPAPAHRRLPTWPRPGRDRTGVTRSRPARRERTPGRASAATPARDRAPSGGAQGAGLAVEHAQEGLLPRRPHPIHSGPWQSVAKAPLRSDTELRCSDGLDASRAPRGSKKKNGPPRWRAACSEPFTCAGNTPGDRLLSLSRRRARAARR